MQSNLWRPNAIAQFWRTAAKHATALFLAATVNIPWRLNWRRVWPGIAWSTVASLTAPALSIYQCWMIKLSGIKAHLKYQNFQNKSISKQHDWTAVLCKIKTAVEPGCSCRFRAWNSCISKSGVQDAPRSLELTNFPAEKLFTIRRTDKPFQDNSSPSKSAWA